MAGEDEAQGAALTGALIGWRRSSASHGILLTLQVIESAAQYRDRRFHHVTMALNDRQLRSLARDLARAAQSRGLDLRARPHLPRRVWLGIKGLVVR